MRFSLIPLLFLLSFGLLSSCTKEDGKAGDGKAADSQPKAGKTEDEKKSGDATNPLAGKTSPESGSAPDPALMFKAAQSAAKGNPGALWDMMPAQYQTDIQGVITTFKEKADRELLDAGIGALRKVGQVLDQKAAMITSLPQLAPMLPMAGLTPESATPTLKAAGQALGRLTSGQLKSLSTFNLETFVAQDLAPVITQLSSVMDKIPGGSPAGGLVSAVDEMQIEVLSNDGKTATVKVTQGEEEPVTHTMVLVGNRFVPKEIVDNWDRQVAETNQAIVDNLSGPAAEQAKPMVMMANGMLDQLNAAKTAEEFQAALAPVLGMLMGGR